MAELISNNEVNEKIQKNYADQCLSIKNEIFALLRTSHAEANERKEGYVREANAAAEIIVPLLEQAKELVENISDKVKESKDLLKKEFDSLKEQYELGSICINASLKRADDLELAINARMDKLESYIKNERFHDIVKEINELEVKFEKEAMKLVQNRMKNK